MKSIIVLFALLFIASQGLKAQELRNSHNTDHYSREALAHEINEDIKAFNEKGLLPMSLAFLVHLELKKSEDLTVAEAVKKIANQLEDDSFPHNNK